MNRILIGIISAIALPVAAGGSTLVFANDITIDQQNKTFVLNNAKVETITVNEGDTIHFTNKDPWFHNIFSLSDLKTFDLGSYPQGESRPVTFDKKGTVDVECAIHPNMHLKVTVK
ncbi:MAG: methylamine utilization protein [Gammaproteobacteria bacterium]|nr:methylamine utilization protein [Gammaproteobacteria bacterium]